MKDEDRKDQVNRKFEQIRSQLHFAPGPTGDDVPDWLKDGVEDLYEFFNSTAELWDHKFGTDLENPLYKNVAQQIEPTDEAVRILDLGCGTGLELRDVFARAVKAQITGVDLAPRMLEKLRGKFKDKEDQIKLIEGNYLDIPLGDDEYDYAIATLTVHHLPPYNKLKVYEKIRRALKIDGIYIEGDQSVLPENEDLSWYDKYVSKLPGGDQARWNWDITLSVETNTRLLNEAGFQDVKLIWEDPDNLAVLSARN